jgi:hypothetical protein
MPSVPSLRSLFANGSLKPSEVRFRHPDTLRDSLATPSRSSGPRCDGEGTQ